MINTKNIDLFSMATPPLNTQHKRNKTPSTTAKTNNISTILDEN